jgi:hypothetical protein
MTRTDAPCFSRPVTTVLPTIPVPPMTRIFMVYLLSLLTGSLQNFFRMLIEQDVKMLL